MINYSVCINLCKFNIHIQCISPSASVAALLLWRPRLLLPKKDFNWRLLLSFRGWVHYHLGLVYSQSEERKVLKQNLAVLCLDSRESRQKARDMDLAWACWIHKAHIQWLTFSNIVSLLISSQTVNHLGTKPKNMTLWGPLSFKTLIHLPIDKNIFLEKLSIYFL